MSQGLMVGALAISIAAAGQTLAAGRPDFSGSWVTTAGDDIGTGWGDRIVARQDTKTLTIEYQAFATDDLQPPLRFNYALDGTRMANSVMMGRGVQTVDSKAKWMGDKLVIVTTYPFSSPADDRPTSISVRQVLSMPSPGILVVEAFRDGVMGGPATMTRTTYKKP